MIHSEWILLAIFGFGLAGIGGLGNHLLAHFRGRALESYARLKGKPERFGQILDDQEDALIATSYLFIFGASIALVSSGTWLFVAWDWDSWRPDSSVPISVWQLASLSSIAAGVLVCLHWWIPKLLVQSNAAVLLFHTWWIWKGLLVIVRPFRALEYLFLALGYRLNDRRVDPNYEEELLEDEIRKMVLVGERDGLVTRSMRDMISSVMNLDEGIVSQIMTPRSQVDAIEINQPWSETLAIITSSGRTRIPVYEESLENVVGILFVKDLISYLSSGQIDLDANQLRGMLREAWLIPGSRKVDELLKDFMLRRNHMAIVVDEFQQTIGVVTIEDALEEIVGEIADELDNEVTLPEYVEEGNGGFSVSGMLEVSTANRQMSLELPESDEYETIAGLLITQLGTLPTVGTETNIGRYSLKVTQASPRQVLRIHIGMATHQQLIENQR